MSLLDAESSDVVPESDKSNVTTDDEFYGELMEAPPEFDDHLIPDDCSVESKGIEHLTKCLNYRFQSYPVVFIGTLKEALTEAFSPKDVNERRPFLVYVNNDKSVYTHLFCKQLLCNDEVIEYLMNNYVLWAWDITFKSNEQKLNEICRNIFPSWTNEKQFNAGAIDEYPLLIGIYRDTNGNYLFSRLIEGSTEKPNREQFLFSLKEFKDKFYLSENNFEKAKEEAKQQMLKNLFQHRNIHRRSKHRNERELFRSLSMFSHAGYDNSAFEHRPPLSRLLSEDIGINAEEYFSSNPVAREEMIRTFEQFHMNPDDADDEDDDKTPTIGLQTAKFP